MWPVPAALLGAVCGLLYLTVAAQAAEPATDEAPATAPATAPVAEAPAETAPASEPATMPVDTTVVGLADAGEAGDAEPPQPPPMTQERLLDLLRRERLSPETADGQTVFYVDNVRMLALVDSTHDRMRFAVPVQKLGTASAEDLLAMLKANYAATVDVRFAVNREVIWLLYLHPLSSLTERDALAAINQLAYHAHATLNP